MVYKPLQLETVQNLTNQITPTKASSIKIRDRAQKLMLFKTLAAFLIGCVSVAHAKDDDIQGSVIGIDLGTTYS